MSLIGWSVMAASAGSQNHPSVYPCKTGQSWWIVEWWMFMVVPFSEGWLPWILNTAILGSINSIHFITVYTIHWGYILCTFFHIHIHYFTHILYMYLLILYMHTFTHVLLIYFILVLYTYYIYYTNSMFTYTLNSRNYYTHFLQCLRSIVTLQLLCILYKHYQFLCT